MIINEEELRTVIKKLLLQEKMEFQYKGPPKYIEQLLGRTGEYTTIGSSGTAGSAGTTIKNPADFDVVETYKNVLKNKQTNRAARDTIMLMSAFGSQVDLASIDPSKILP